MNETNQLLGKGEAECIYTPIGEGGLEGYSLGDIYTYEYMSCDRNGKPYYRVYLGDDDYETCGERLFSKFFKPIPLVEVKESGFARCIKDIACVKNGLHGLEYLNWESGKTYSYELFIKKDKHRYRMCVDENCIDFQKGVFDDYFIIEIIVPQNA